jgi:hypothetical protein
MNLERLRYKFIAHALEGSGPFRPVITYNHSGEAFAVSDSYLIRYPRESDLKYYRRNQLAWFSSSLSAACNRFAGYFSLRSPMRDYNNELYVTMADDVDGKGNNIDVFWQQFMVQAKARGAMCLLVDMPPVMANSLAGQIENRVLPYITPIKPENITDFEIGDDGKFVFVEFEGKYTKEDGGKVDCTWHFDREGWYVYDNTKRTLNEGQHPLGECPVLIFSESGDYPNFGPFSEIADISRRLFNLHSELDEILRSQTFSLLTMQVPEGTTDEQKISAARAVGETIGTSNLLVHSGSTPAFIAPSDGPAKVYLDTISKLEGMVREIGLDVRGSEGQESGVSLQMRFHSLNAALASFSGRMEDLERRMWELSRRWLGLTQSPEVTWPRDFNLSDIESEMLILQQMQANAMPTQVVVEQQKRIVSIQFAGLDQNAQDRVFQSIDDMSAEVRQ